MKTAASPGSIRARGPFWVLFPPQSRLMKQGLSHSVNDHVLNGTIATILLPQDILFAIIINYLG